MNAEINNEQARYENIDTLINLAVFSSDRHMREEHQRIIREMAFGQGIYPEGQGVPIGRHGALPNGNGMAS